MVKDIRWCMELECPSESCDYTTDTEYGLKVHHGQTHEEPYPDNVYECENCGNNFTASPSEKSKYCSHSCFSDDSKGENRGFGSSDADYRNKEWLAEKLSEHDLSTIADECGVQIDTIRKWKDKHEIGLEYECPTCDKMFSSLSGRNSHHTHVHGESIRGSEYECETCGEKFSDYRTENHNAPPQYCSIGCRKTSSNRVINPETGNELDSEWELEVEKILCENEVEYQHENERFIIDDSSYKPDFTANGWVLEVKGRGGYIWDEEKYNKIGEWMKENTDREYIIVGSNIDMPCDTFFDYHLELDTFIKYLSE